MSGKVLTLLYLIIMDKNLFTDRNKHNETVGSNVKRSDERIIETGEVFTPSELCNQMVSDTQ